MVDTVKVKKINKNHQSRNDLFFKKNIYDKKENFHSIISSHALKLVLNKSMRASDDEQGSTNFRLSPFISFSLVTFASSPWANLGFPDDFWNGGVRSRLILSNWLNSRNETWRQWENMSIIISIDLLICC